MSRIRTDENIDGLLMERHMAKVARRKSKNHLKDRRSGSTGMTGGSRRASGD